MQLTKTIFLDSPIFIEKKRVENRLWRNLPRKSSFCGEKVKNAGERKLIHHWQPRGTGQLYNPLQAHKSESEGVSAEAASCYSALVKVGEKEKGGGGGTPREGVSVSKP
jgi:hypothetical protein